MTIYECSEENCSNFVLDNPGLGCAKHGLKMEEIESETSK